MLLMIGDPIAYKLGSKWLLIHNTKSESGLLEG